ncbi:unnamed protein product [Caenorhabditis brenneri]
MSGTIRNVFFILKDIEITDIFQRFSVFLKIENYEPLEMGHFVKGDLPNGLTFPVLLEDQWFEKPEIDVEIRTNGLVYAGIFEIGETLKNSNLSISGIATVYNTRDPSESISLECTILVENPVMEPEEEKEKKIMMTRETQTEKEKPKSVKNGETQTVPPPTPPPPPPPISTSDASTNTDEPHLSLEDLQPILTNSIAKHLKERLPNREPKKTKEDPIEDPTPSKPPVHQNVLQNSTYNLFPRMSKLKDLDAIIKQKETQLAILNLEIETNRNLKKVIEMRAVMKEKKEKKAEVEAAEKSENKMEPEPPKKAPSESEETSFSSRSSTSGTESSETGSSDSSSEETSSSSSSSSPLSSAETVRAAPPAQNPAVQNKSDGDSTIEDPFSSRQESSPPEEVPPESPTTAYLNQVRSNIMNQMQKRYL